MMLSGLINIKFSDKIHWVAVGGLLFKISTLQPVPINQYYKIRIGA